MKNNQTNNNSTNISNTNNKNNTGKINNMNNKNETGTLPIYLQNILIEANLKTNNDPQKALKNVLYALIHRQTCGKNEIMQCR